MSKKRVKNKEEKEKCARVRKMFTSGSDSVSVHAIFSLAVFCLIHSFIHSFACCLLFILVGRICIVRMLFMSISMRPNGFVCYILIQFGQKNRQTLRNRCVIYVLCAHIHTMRRRQSNTIMKTSECFCHHSYLVCVFCTSTERIVYFFSV